MLMALIKSPTIGHENVEDDWLAVDIRLWTGGRLSFYRRRIEDEDTNDDDDDVDDDEALRLRKGSIVGQ